MHGYCRDIYKVMHPLIWTFFYSKMYKTNIFLYFGNIDVSALKHRK